MANYVCLSVLKSIINPASSLRWNIINQIRDLLIKHGKRLQLLWIPGHNKIEGNVPADQSAKFASIAPLLMGPTTEKHDRQFNKITSSTETNFYFSHSKEINNNRIPYLLNWPQQPD